MKRGQYSLEFLLTYSWAFLVIGIALAAIYTFGWINIDDILPEKCEFYGQIYCKDFQASSQGVQLFDQNNLSLILVNRFGTDIVITSATISDPINSPICGLNTVYTHPDYDGDLGGVRWNNSDELHLDFTVCHYADTGSAGAPPRTQKWIPGTRIESTINVTFYNPDTALPPDQVLHNQLGTLYVFIREES